MYYNYTYNCMIDLLNECSQVQKDLKDEYLLLATEQ